MTVRALTGKCNRCGTMQKADSFANTGIVSGPLQRFSTDRYSIDGGDE